MVSAQRGDASAYLVLLRDIRPYVRNILLRQAGHMERAEDITQDVLLAVHQARDTWHAELAFLPWLHGIMRYKVHDNLRELYRRQSLEVADETAYETFPAPPTNTEGEGRDMERLFSTLTPRQRKLLTLTKVEGYTAAEAGRELGMSPTAVKVTVHRVLKQLKSVFGGTI